jgi:hypothetical protein
MDAIGKSIEQDKDLVQIPDLNWMVLSQENIPSDFPVESIPQLQEAWTHTDEASTRLISNATIKGGITIKTASQEDIVSVIKQAKKEMMLGYTGKQLADRLSSLYMPELIYAAKEELVKLATEQGLLGKVYIDLTPFDSCHEAANVLGKNRIRTARYVVGNPTRKVCSSHHNGFCKELNKRVKEAMDYSDPILKEYTTHLRVAGVIEASETITSKDNLREAFLRQPEVQPEVVAQEAAPIDMGKVQENFATQLEKSAVSQEKLAAEQRFFAARPILAFMQDQLLKGKTGEALKESIRQKFSSTDIIKYSSEIAKVASLQGVLGNIYVDISYYKNPEEAIHAIKTANTNPIYLVQSYKQHSFDTALAKVASATGCSTLPRDGKLDKKVAFSYIKDLQANNRIASNVSQALLNKVLSGDSSLKVIKEAFDATLSHRREVRVGGVQGVAAPVVAKQALDRNELKNSVMKAIIAGVAIDHIEDKVANMIGTTEAIGMIRKVLAGAQEVSADCLSKCTSERYDLSRTASIKPSIKCKECVLKGASSCIKQATNFIGSIDLDKAFFDIREASDSNIAKPEIEDATKEVLFDENPDVDRGDMNQKYDMSSPGGSGMNIALEKMKERTAGDFDIDFNNRGIDSHLSQ